jgi:hypothetical protein
LRELEEALRALTPIPEHRVASGALGWCEVGIEDRTLLVPLRPLSARHLTYYQSTRRNLLTDVLKLRLARFGCSLLHTPHLHSLVAETADDDPNLRATCGSRSGSWRRAGCTTKRSTESPRWPRWGELRCLLAGAGRGEDRDDPDPLGAANRRTAFEHGDVSRPRD